MGKQNMEMYRYLDDATRFADLFNATQFAGTEVVNAGSLKEASGHYVKEKGQLQLQETFRDLKKRMENGTELRILAVENQNQVDYTMPWRLMDYDVSEYGRQIRQIQRKNEAEINKSGDEKLRGAQWLCEFRKSDRVAPVYTICLYHGEDVWDGPRSLRDMVEFGDDSESWKQMFADYPMRLVCVNEMTDFSGFKSSLGQLFRVLALRNDKKAMKNLFQENPEYHHVDRDTMEAIAIMTNSEKMLENMEKYENEEGGYEMCRAFAELIEDGKKEGREEGREELIRTMLESGISCEELSTITKIALDEIMRIKGKFMLF